MRAVAVDVLTTVELPFPGAVVVGAAAAVLVLTGGREVTNCSDFTKYKGYIDMWYILNDDLEMRTSGLFLH